MLCIYSLGLSVLLKDRTDGCSATDIVVLISFSLRTLFKFVKKFEEALNGPSVPTLVEQGSSASLDSVDANPEETPIHRVHQALRSSLPGKGRDLQVQVSQRTQSLYCFHDLKQISSFPLVFFIIFIQLLSCVHDYKKMS